MVWSNWQGAIWRGAIVVVLIWSGLAWTQAPAQRPGDSADRIMVVHENGRKIRCRIEETWQLPDGRVAHLLQALETGEKITIVDDQAAPLDPLVKNQKAMPKRIFAWGLGRTTPPEGSPLPPHLRIDSGIVINQDAPPPAGLPVATPVKVADVQVLDFQKIDPQVAHPSGAPSTGGLQIIQTADPNDKNVPPIIQDGDALPSLPVPSIPIVMPNNPAAPTTNITQAPVTTSVPSVLPGAPVVPEPNVTQAPAAPCVGPSVCTEDPAIRRPWRPGEKVMDWLQNRRGPTVVTVADTAPPIPGVVAQPIAQPSVVTESTGTVVSEPKIVQDKAPDAVEKKSWRPGERIVNWFSGKSPASPPKVETAKATDAKKVESVLTLPKSEDAVKVQKTEDYLAQENKLLEKKLQEKIVKTQPGPFSTAMSAQPDAKKSEAGLVLPAPAPGDAKQEKTAGLPPPPGEVKQAIGPMVEKKDMWGIGSADSVLPPGKSVVEGAVKPADIGKVPPVAQTRVNDPLTMPERFVDRRAATLGPMSSGDMMPGDPSLGGGYPLGSQSVLAARSGMLGPVTYIPVPTVTVPQPFNPPLPPEPKMPSPPQLNSYVNAFSPPPQPKGTQEYSNQGMMPAQAMNPMMQQQMAMQQQMMQQQMMQQQMMQQQAMNPYGYRPNTYPQVASQGPTTNFGRQYQGPQAPNPTGPAMPAGYAPMAYPPMQQPMMPQQQPVQQVGYQQPSAPATQVDQLIKVLRESPYPAQREWAAQSLTSFEWRVHPHIVPNLLQSASQDPAGSVRAGCVSCLGRMQAAVEPVYTTLNSLRNDIDPRVRQEVQQTLVRLGQTPMAPSGN